MGHETVKQFAIKEGALATLYAAGIATFAATFVVGDTTGAADLAANVIQLGAPVALGAAVANVISPPSSHKKPTQYLMRGLLGGGATAVALIVAGALPMTLDVQLMSLIGLAGISIVLGDAAAIAIDV